MVLSERSVRYSPIVYNASVRPLLILFARAPIPGRTKTRLIPALTAEQAASLHHAFVLDMLLRFDGLPFADLELHTDESNDAWAEVKVARKLQIKGCLGLRMLHGLRDGISTGRPVACIAGTDAPTLPRSHIEELMKSRADVTLGPSEDGGFYAIAARKTDPRMFDGVVWSREDTLAQTILAIEACGLSVALGPSWYDIDEPADLQRLCRSGDLPPRTAAWLSESGIER